MQFAVSLIVWCPDCSRKLADVRRRRLSPPSCFLSPSLCLRWWDRYAGSGGSYQAAQTWCLERVIHYRWQTPDLSVRSYSRGAAAGSRMGATPPAPHKYHGKYQHDCTSWLWSAHMGSAHECMYPRRCYQGTSSSFVLWLPFPPGFVCAIKGEGGGDDDGASFWLDFWVQTQVKPLDLGLSQCCRALTWVRGGLIEVFNSWSMPPTRPNKSHVLKKEIWDKTLLFHSK